MTYQDQLRRVGLCLVDPRTVETLWSDLEPIGTDDLHSPQNLRPQLVSDPATVDAAIKHLDRPRIQQHDMLVHWTLCRCTQRSAEMLYLEGTGST
jgi:hypothetical protein